MLRNSSRTTSSPRPMLIKILSSLQNCRVWASRLLRRPGRPMARRASGSKPSRSSSWSTSTSATPTGTVHSSRAWPSACSSTGPRSTSGPGTAARKKRLVGKTWIQTLSLKANHTKLARALKRTSTSEPKATKWPPSGPKRSKTL